MAEIPFYIRQNVFKNSHPPISVVAIDESKVTARIINDFLTSGSDDFIGVAPIYGPKCALFTVALSTLSQVLVIKLSSPKARTKKKHGKSSTPQLTPGRGLLKDKIFCSPDYQKAALRMDRVCLSLFQDHNMRITGAVDLLSLAPPKDSRHTLQAVMSALGGETTLQRANVKALFKHEESASTSVPDVALQAWLACRTASLPSLAKGMHKINRINTELFGEEELQFLAKTRRDADRMDALKPNKVKNDVNGEFSTKTGDLNLSSSRFRTRIMRSTNQTIQIVTTTKGKQNISTGHAKKVSGRSATIALRGPLQGDKIKSVHTLGKEDPTNAEVQRANIVLKTLQRSLSTLQRPFVQSIWLPSVTPAWLATMSSPRAAPTINFNQRPLNSSQECAVNCILSDRQEDRVTVIQGPPGTGKTTVIAASVVSLTSSSNRRTMWLVAQSNVAVKNIAEKLADVGFLDFKLLVSKDFHFDWHEHLYEELVANVVRSDGFPDDIVAASRLLLGSRVILCTLSMLSNPKIAVFTRLVPVEVVIVDEASQIEVGDYLPLLSRYEKTLRKLVFIGDDKQLAPYGQDDLGDLRSVFEIDHLRDRAIFLDTQYRMPVPIGNFISHCVYDRKLKTQHKVTSLLCCRFVDVQRGKELSVGKSWANQREVQAAVNIARRYDQAGKAFRIITPYDPQRNMLEKGLQAAHLPWQDKCFNVDSFQGNEDDHIIISLVRSEKLGFLTNMRRTNVMLTRCKKSMVICTSRAFIEGIAASTLMGKFAEVLGESAWLHV